MAKATPAAGPTCPICDGLLQPGDKVVEIKEMYQGSPTYWPTPVALYPNGCAHLRHFMQDAPDLRESKG